MEDENSSIAVLNERVKGLRLAETENKEWQKKQDNSIDDIRRSVIDQSHEVRIQLEAIKDQLNDLTTSQIQIQKEEKTKQERKTQRELIVFGAVITAAFSILILAIDRITK